MAKIDDYKIKYVGTGPGQVTEKEFKKISELDSPPHAMVPWMIKMYNWLKDRIGKKVNGIKDDKDAMKTLQNIVGEFKQYKSNLRQKDFNFYDYPTLLAELTDVKVMKLKKEIDKIEGAKLLVQEGDKSLYLILTMEAAQKYGAGTRWCISATRSQSMWSSYTGGKSNIFFFVIDLEPVVENREKVAIQVHNIHKVEKTKGSGVSYDIRFWNVIDNSFDQYPELPESFRLEIDKVCSSEKGLEEYTKLKSDKERVAKNIESQAIEAEKIQKTFQNPAMYIMSEMNLPKVWVDKLIPEVRLLHKGGHDFKTLRNMRHGSIISIGGSSQMESLGDLEDVCDLLDVRRCPNITSYSKLESLYAMNDKGEMQEAEVYYDNDTNRGLLNHIYEIIKKTGKGKMIYYPPKNGIPDEFKPE